MYFTCLKRRNLIFALALVLTGIFSALTLSFSGAYAVFYGGTLRKLPIYAVERQDNRIAISFDCAWGVDYTDTLLSVMAEENVKCTFFAVRFWSEKYPEYLLKISEAGHEIGTHSSTHPYMSKLDAAAIEKELTDSSSAIEKITGQKVTLFRPPYGDYDDLLIETAERLGLYTIQWSVDSLDWKDLSAGEITERVIKRVKSGAIVLFHNQGKHTAEALPAIITALKEKGYEFVPIGELIYKSDYKILPDGTQKSLINV